MALSSLRRLENVVKNRRTRDREGPVLSYATLVHLSEKAWSHASSSQARCGNSIPSSVGLARIRHDDGWLDFDARRLSPI
jgi:hypothetical protein